MAGSAPRCFSMPDAQVAKFIPCTSAVMVFISCPPDASLPHRCATAQRATPHHAAPATAVKIAQMYPHGPRMSASLGPHRLIRRGEEITLDDRLNPAIGHSSAE